MTRHAAQPTPRPQSSGLLVLWALAAIICLNLAWEHQVLLTQMVKVKDYYAFAARAPFIYRILPAWICHMLLPGAAGAPTGLPEPLDSHASVFQLVMDTICLGVAFLFMTRIAAQLNPRLSNAVILTFTATTALLIVVFGYFMVPNNSFFYPYDFPDLCIAVVIFYLSMQAGRTTELLLPVAVFVATLNKETAAFYAGTYLIFGMERRVPWRRLAAVLAGCAAAALLARATVLLWLRRHGLDSAAGGAEFEVHVAYTLQQLRNPLFVFAMLNVCSYLYLPVWALRRRFDRTDWLILAMVLAWVLIVTTFGMVRQLRLYVPASLLLFLILARHLAQSIEAFDEP